MTTQELNEEEVLDLIRSGATTKDLNNPQCKQAVLKLFMDDKIIIDQICNGHCKLIEKVK